MTTEFNPQAAKQRVEKFWSLGAEFGKERNAYNIYLNEVVSDRYVLVNGLQLLRDELQLAGLDQDSDVSACGADFSLPSVCSTIAHTNCGDRIHQGEATTAYQQIVASRFATMSEIGEFKMEAFAPTGGGTDDGKTLAHVTVAHQLDETLRRTIYQGNPLSYVLVGIDLKTHCGRQDLADGTVEFGKTKESKWREPRAACGAIMGTLYSFNPENPVHRRICRDLGENNLKLLSTQGVKSKEGVDITPVVAAAIVSIQGMLNTAHALATELDERGVGHTTASITINRPVQDDTIIYLARATVFNGEIKIQGLGTDASLYSAYLKYHRNEHRLVLTYDNHAIGEYPVRSESYPVNHWVPGQVKHEEE